MSSTTVTVGVGVMVGEQVFEVSAGSVALTSSHVAPLEKIGITTNII